MYLVSVSGIYRLEDGTRRVSMVVVVALILFIVFEQLVVDYSEI